MYQQYNPNQDGFSQYPQQPPEYLKHSGLGIASFVISLVCLLSIIFFVIVAVGSVVSLADVYNGGVLDSSTIMEKAPMLVVSSFIILATMFVNLVGLILGIIGLVMKNRKKVFAIIGTILNGLVVGGVLLLSVIGAMIQS